MGTINKREKDSRARRRVSVFNQKSRLLRTNLTLVTSLVPQTYTLKFWKKEYLLNAWSLFHLIESQASSFVHFKIILESLDQKKSRNFTGHEDVSIKLVTTGCSAKQYIQIEMPIFSKVWNKFKQNFRGCKNI